jgi:hypothetical protein
VLLLERQALLWKNGTRLPLQGNYINEGIIPVGFAWAMNPIPFINGRHTQCQNTTVHALDEHGQPCRVFDPPCPQDQGWYTTAG